MVKGACVCAFLLIGLFFTPRDLLAVGPHSATGSGQINGPNGAVRTFSFNAVINAAGVVTGHAELHDPVFFNESGHADVNCLAVSGNRAAIGGIVTQSDPPVLWAIRWRFWLWITAKGPLHRQTRSALWLSPVGKIAAHFLD